MKSKTNLGMMGKKGLSTNLLFCICPVLFFFNTKAQPSFTNIASTAGVTIGTGAKDGGVAWGDLNNDGRLDLIVNTFNSTNKTRIFFQNASNTFTDVTGSLFNSLDVTERSVVIGDVNNDGNNDFIVNTHFVLYIFRNNGPPSYNFSLHATVNVSWLASRGGSGMNSEGLSLFDMEGDGDLDLLIEDHQFGVEILENDGSGNFSLYTTDANTRGLGNSGSGDYATTADYDADGDIDLLIRRDGTGNNNDQADLFRNNGNGTFTRITTPNHFADNANKGGVTFADLDNDGDFDIIYTDDGFPSNRSRCVIYQQERLNSGVFSVPIVTVTGSSTELPSTNQVDGIAVGDVNNDGKIDLFFTNNTGPSFLFLNTSTGPGIFRFNHVNSGIDVNADGEGASFADYDNDGDLDLYVNVNNGNNQLWRNNLAGSSATAYLKVLPQINLGGGRKRVATGATVVILNCGGSIVSGIQQVDGGSGHGSQMSPVLHFGLPNGRDAYYRVVVKFVKPNSGTQRVVTRIVRPSDLAGQFLEVLDTDVSNPSSFSANAGPNILRCSGSNTFAMAANSVPGTFGRWSLVSGSATIADISSPTTNVTIPLASSATLRWTLSNGCDSSSATVRITHGDFWTFSISGPNDICSGQTATYTANASGTYQWHNGATTQSIPVSTAGSYRVTVTNSFGCMVTGTKILTVHNPPSASLSGPSTICSGSTVTLTASGGGTYLWNTGATSSSISVSTAGTYTVTVTNAAGCTATASRVLTAATSPTASISGTNSICSGQSTTFTASGGGTYLWNTGSTTAAVTLSIAGTYTVTVTNASGCTATASRVLTMNQPPTTANAGNNQTQCGNGTFTMSANTPQAGTGAWSIVSGSASIANPTSPSTVVNNVPAGETATLRWTISTPSCGSSTSDVILTNNTPPTVANAGPDQSRCGGGSTFTLAANNPSSGTGQWSVVSGTANILNPSQHNSVVQVVSGKSAVLRWTITKPGCAASMDEMQITNHYAPPAANAGNDQTKCNSTFELNANSTRLVVVLNTRLATNGLTGSATVEAYGGTPPYSYQWSNGSTVQNQINIPVGDYTVTVSDAGGNVVVKEAKIVSVINVIKKGSFIVNMGSSVQTVANGLRPYGMVYDLVNNFNVPVYWIINPNKAKDGADFTHNGTEYRGSSFIVPVQFRTSRVDSVINYWITQGVIGATSVSDMELPVAQVITSFPKLIIDQANQSLVDPIFTMVGIPSSAYRVGLPSDLSSCDDLYALPHADPTWNTHHFLYNFVNNGGYVWSSCHAVSVFEGLFNPSNPSQRMNFLSTTGLQCYDANKCGSLITQSHPKTPTLPFRYSNSVNAHPVMQFMGDMTPATANGSEQWFIPQTTGMWRNGVVRAITTADGSPGREGVKMVFGHGFGDTTKGMVMYVGGHNITNNGGMPAMVAALRSFMNFALLAGNNKKIQLSHDIGENYIAGSTSTVSVTPSGGTPPYTYHWNSTGEIFLSANNTQSINITVPEFPTGTRCFLTCVIRDACGRKNFISIPINSINMPPDSADLTVAGRWRVVSGSATISDSTQNNTTVTIPQGTTAKLEWRIQSGACGTTRDTVQLVSLLPPTPAQAGDDQEKTNGPSDFTLAANTPIVGVGTWTVVQGNAVVNQPNSPTSTVIVNLGDTARLRWTISNGSCESYDEMVIRHRTKGCVAIESGEWNLPTTWSGNCSGGNGYPGINDTAIISGKTVTVSRNSACKLLQMSNLLGVASLQIQNTGELTVVKDIEMRATDQNTVTIDLIGNGKLNLGGTVKRNAPPMNFGKISSSPLSTIHLNGTEQQILPTSRGAGSDGIQYQNVIFNNTSGIKPAFIAEGRVDVLNTIALQNGCIDMGRDTIMLSNSSHLSVSGGSDSSFVMGQFCRYIGIPGVTYRWSVGRRDKEGEFWFELKNNLLVGTSYVCVEFDTVPEDSKNGIHYAANDWVANYLAPEGIWRAEPNAQPISGTYDVNVSTRHFSGLTDGRFGLLKRPTGGSPSSWGNAGGILPTIGDTLRLLSTQKTAMYSLSSFSEFGIGSGRGSSLPVKLTTFEAKPIENKFIRLRWVTETEVDNMGFEVHRSANGKEFNTIGWINGNGNTTETKVYNFDDKTIDPNIRYYYRLKQVDFDGHSEFSPIATAEIRNSGGLLEVGEFSPNPAKNNTSIHITTDSDMDAEFTFFDLMGKVAKRGFVSLTKGSHLYYFDIHEFATGNYIVSITTKTNNQTKKLIVY